MAVCWNHGNYPSTHCPGCQDLAEEKLETIKKLADCDIIHLKEEWEVSDLQGRRLEEIKKIVDMPDAEFWETYGRE